MKRMAYRIAALGLALLLCTSAAAQTADDVSYTMAEKFLKQLEYGSGFEGNLTITADAVEGRESDAFSTIMPIVMDVRYIQRKGGEAEPAQTRLTVTLDASEYQQGSAEFSLQGSETYMRSSLFEDGWYLLGGGVLEPLLAGIGVQGVLPAVPDITQATGQMPGTMSFISGIAGSLFSMGAGGLNAITQDYLTAIDFWLEGYRQTVQMTTLSDGASAMEIAYRVPPDAVKAQLKQLIVDLMNDEVFLKNLTAMMPAEQAALYLDPELQPYYFYAVDGLPLEDDLTIRRVMSLQGDTVEMEIVMPLYDSVSGAATLTYASAQGGADIPDENTLSLESRDGYLELNYRSSEALNGTAVYQGTILSRGAEENGTIPPVYWAAFDLSMETQTTKDLRGYETLYQTVKLSTEPAAIPDGADASAYAVFSKTDLQLDMKFSSLSLKTSPTNADITLTVSGNDMAQTLTFALSGATTAQWTPEAFDAALATDLQTMPAEELQALLSQAAVKAGLLFLPYINLPQITVPEGN